MKCLHGPLQENTSEGMGIKSLSVEVVFRPVRRELHDMLFCSCFAKARSEPERNEDLNIIPVSVRPCVSCLTSHTYRIDCTKLSICILLFWYCFRLHFQLHFRVLLRSEKGMAMHSLCETSCPPRTVHYIRL